MIMEEKNKATFTIEGFAMTQRKAWQHDNDNSAVRVPRNWDGKNVVCIVTDKPTEED
jgi:hypothetical protein